MIFSNILWFFLPLIFLLGIVTSYTDIKSGKIFNKHLLGALVILTLVYIYLFFSSWNFVQGYFLNLIVNFIISFVIGFIFWSLGLWSSADAKLFAVYSLVVPLMVYSRNYYALFPSLTLLINSFVPFFIGFSIKSFFSASFRERKKMFSNILMVDIINLILAVFVLMWIPKLILQFLGFRPIFVLNLLIMLGSGFVLNKVFGDKLIFVLSSLAVVRIIFDYEFVVSFIFLKQFFLLIIFLVGIFFLIKMSSRAFVSEMDITDVKKGMILAEKINYKSGSGNKEVFLEHPAEGLTSKDVKVLLKLHRGKKIGSNIKIYQTLPFAPFMFGGVLFTLVLGGDFIASLVSFFIG